MPLPLKRSVVGDDVLAHSITTLETIKEVSGAIGSVPFLGAVTGAALSLIKTIEKVKGDKERRIRLARRVFKLLQDVEEAVVAHPDAADGTLMANLAVLQSKLSSIQVDLEGLRGKSATSRWLRRGTIAAQLDEHIDIVEEASSSFTRTFLISLSRAGNEHTNGLRALARDLGEQALYDKNQLRIIRGCDLALRRVRDKWQHGGISGEEWEAEWQGRQVTVRALHGDAPEEALLTSISSLNPICRHPYLLQVIGRSHPSETQRFLVLDRGFAPAAQYLKNNDALAGLRCYLQMYIDFEDLFNFLISMQFPVAQPGEIHEHNARCLSSIGVRDDGTLVLPAEDLAHANLRCLDCCLRSIVHPKGQLIWNHETQYVPIAHNARVMLSFLQGDKETASNTDLRRFRGANAGPLPEIWCAAHYHGPPRVGLGDYGYLEPSSGAFVCLGNVYEELQIDFAFRWIERHLSDDTSSIANTYHSWSERRTSHMYRLEQGNFGCGHIQKQLPDDIHASFWWLNAHDVAVRCNIPLERLVLIRATIQEWVIDAFEFSDAKMSPNAEYIYFHELSCAQGGTPLHPFGFWSLDSTPAPGPWPAIQLEGLQLHSWVEVVYTHLNTFQASLVTCFANNLQRKRFDVIDNVENHVGEI